MESIPKGLACIKPQLSDGLRSAAELRGRFPSPGPILDDAATVEAAVSLPFRTTPFYLSLARDESADPILRQILPSASELAGRPPRGSEALLPVPGRLDAGHRAFPDKFP
ncbi:MAG: hypothetical protein NT080_05495 [Spirochaetes bacterium]|nr:hypothetical protein [Spirochaetota bacterium]